MNPDQNPTVVEKVTPPQIDVTSLWKRNEQGYNMASPNAANVMLAAPAIQQGRSLLFSL